MMSSPRINIISNNNNSSSSILEVNEFKGLDLQVEGGNKWNGTKRYDFGAFFLPLCFGKLRDYVGDRMEKG